ncbi:hypothetical protein NC651_018955 [Populus alba x Populus x berolinensis]|nr:hypothetical protein NC651_018955 [Populus alba x Populus x berolinensis]
MAMSTLTKKEANSCHNRYQKS